MATNDFPTHRTAGGSLAATEGLKVAAKDPRTQATSEQLIGTLFLVESLGTGSYLAGSRALLLTFAYRIKAMHFKYITGED